MATDKYGNVVIKKDFWADGAWAVVFILIPVLLGWGALALILLYGVYVTFVTEPEYAKAGFMFIILAFGTALTLISLAKSVWSLLTEKFIFAGDRLIYRGFNSYSLPYQSIQAITIHRRRGPFGAERTLVFVAFGDYGKKELFAIPRWKTLAAVIGRELSRRAKLSLLDRTLLSFYTAKPNHDWLFSAVLGGTSVIGLIFFFLARTSTATTAGLTAPAWLLLIGGTIIFIAYYLNRRKDVILNS